MKHDIHAPSPVVEWTITLIFLAMMFWLIRLGLK
jgi:hypothetical protein